MTEKAASDLSKKALSDNAKYDPLDIALSITDDIHEQLIESIKKHERQIRESDQDEFCLVYVFAHGDPLLKNLIRKKFYVWPYLPSPRPSQGVFLYNKRAEQITKRLWILPNAMKMAQLAETINSVHYNERFMQMCCRAFYKGVFWDFIRKHHNINMLSQEEYFELNRHELLKLGIDIRNPGSSEPFDFSKICPDNITYSTKTSLDKRPQDIIGKA